jgi:hypothetical protein
LKRSLEQRKQPAAPKRAAPKAASVGAKGRGRAARKSESKAAPRRKRA